MRQEPNNPLFQAFGGSYVQAYSAASVLDFNENTPIPDGSGCDVKGAASSVLHGQGDPPLFLGILQPEI
ncbi:MAG TPA: hypothetical protein PKE04_01105, partial [Clostridia bacterium]|nr:hypothetical protein [Clostridia bacterium]